MSQDGCDHGLGSILKNGFSNTVQLVISHFRKKNMEFEMSESRSLQFILDALKDGETLSLIEFISTTIDQLF